jgi:ubiquinol-cytochrome c reductase cytochrome c1 subunit
MKNKLILILSVFLPSLALASGGGGSALLHHYKADIELANQDSLRNGAKLFVNYCLSCHSAAFMRYKSVANDLGIDEKKAVEKMLFVADFSKKTEGEAKKIGALMTVAMRSEDAKSWFGNPPPDLSVIARSRGADWLYAYLTTFYLDASRPYGVNNAQFPNVGMPHVLWQLEGMKKGLFETIVTETTYALSKDAKGAEVKTELKVEEKHFDVNGKLKDSKLVRETKKSDVDPKNFKLEKREEKTLIGFEMVQEGQLKEVEYKKAANDLVNFLVYLGEPHKLERQKIGVVVIFFLLILFVFAYLLKREYWKDVH